MEDLCAWVTVYILHHDVGRTMYPLSSQVHRMRSTFVILPLPELALGYGTAEAYPSYLMNFFSWLKFAGESHAYRYLKWGDFRYRHLLIHTIWDTSTQHERKQLYHLQDFNAIQYQAARISL